MVTEAGKELLRNTINTAKFHNRILEENEMWKQWELERGLTMMVSDDIIKQKRKHHLCSRHRQEEKMRKHEKKEDYKKGKRKDDLMGGPSSSRTETDRWDHSGFEELYPSNTQTEKDAISSSGSSSSHSRKWGHGGFEELYPSDERVEKDVSSSSGSSSSSGRRRKKSKKKERKKKRRAVSQSNSSDNEIWEEFKSFKRRRKLEVCNMPDLKEFKNTKDKHVKLWKKS